MATIQKRDSENEMPNTLSNNVGLVKSENEIPNTMSDNVSLVKSDDPVKSIVDRTADMLAAWGAGRFNVGEVEAALAAFFTNDFVLDASSAAYSGVAAYKVHNGFSGLKDWFAFVGSFDFEEMEITHGSGLAAGEVWMRCSAEKAVYKATGKSAPFTSFNVLEWEGDRATKMTIAVHNPASVAAIVSETEIPMPMPMPYHPGCIPVPMDRFERWPQMPPQMFPWGMQPDQPSMGELPEAKPRAQVLQRAFSTASQLERIRWTVDARKLKSTDREAVSPSFEVSCGGLVQFRMVLRPKASSDANASSLPPPTRPHGTEVK